MWNEILCVCPGTPSTHLKRRPRLQHMFPAFCHQNALDGHATQIQHSPMHAPAVIQRCSVLPLYLSFSHLGTRPSPPTVAGIIRHSAFEHNPKSTRGPRTPTLPKHQYFRPISIYSILVRIIGTIKLGQWQFHEITRSPLWLERILLSSCEMGVKIMEPFDIPGRVRLGGKGHFKQKDLAQHQLERLRG